MRMLPLDVPESIEHVSALLLIACGLSVRAALRSPYALPCALLKPLRQRRKPTRPRPLRIRNRRLRKMGPPKRRPARPDPLRRQLQIRLWQTADAFPDLPVINRGFGGSTIADVNHFADRIVFKYKPRVIVFYAGDNDIAAGRSPDSVFRRLPDVRQHRSTSACPKRRLIFLAIKPSIARWKSGPNARSQRPRERTRAAKTSNSPTSTPPRRCSAPTASPQRTLPRRRPPHERKRLRRVEQTPIAGAERFFGTHRWVDRTNPASSARRIC